MYHPGFLKISQKNVITKMKAIIFLYVSTKCHIGEIYKNLFSLMIFLDLNFNEAKPVSKESALV